MRNIEVIPDELALMNDQLTTQTPRKGIDMKKLITTLALLGAVAACTAPTAESYPPVVTQFNGDSVTLQINGAAAFLQAGEAERVGLNAKNEAARICATGSKKRAEMVSATPRYGTNTYIPQYLEVLFLCLH